MNDLAKRAILQLIMIILLKTNEYYEGNNDYQIWGAGETEFGQEPMMKNLSANRQIVLPDDVEKNFDSYMD